MGVKTKEGTEWKLMDWKVKEGSGKKNGDMIVKRHRSGKGWWGKGLVWKEMVVDGNGSEKEW